MERQIVINGIGADVEMFLQHKHTKEIVSAEGIIKGSKYDPFVFDDTNRFFSTSLDNVLAEFTIPPSITPTDFYNNIMKSVNYINGMIPQELIAVPLPAASLNDVWLQTENAQTFGCEPDFNAYTMCENIKPSAEDKNLRSAGGHIHIGYDGATPLGDYYTPDQERCAIIQALDMHIGLPSVLIEPDNKRKELYGKAGAFRPKSYGVEYRTISNFYLVSKEYIEYIHKQVTNAISWLNDGNTIDKSLGNYIQNLINTNDKNGAKQLINHFNISML
jgi:hypothetical protein